MFIMHMPLTFRCGDSAQVNINAEPAKLTWRDDALIINDTDARKILQSHIDGNLRCFVCADAKVEATQ